MRFIGSVALWVVVAGCGLAAAEDALPSWNEGAAKTGILEFVRATTDKASERFVPPEERIATFDEDGTTWVEQPMYTEIVFSCDRLAELAPHHPEWQENAAFKAVIAHDEAAILKLTGDDMTKLVVATHTGVSTQEFARAANQWLATAKHPRWHRRYTELAYEPMLEVMRLLRANGYKTYVVTGGTQPFVRCFAEKTYGIGPEQIVGTAVTTTFNVAKPKGELVLDAKMLLNNLYAGKAEDIYLFTGRRPRIAFGNTSGDREMLEYTTTGEGARMGFLVMHDDATREYAYGPAGGLPDTNVGAFSQPLLDEAKARRWTVISMKRDWKRVFSFDE
jgi:phosphoserine phosphatase